MEDCRVVVELNRPSQAIDSSIVLPQLVRDLPEQMQRIGMIWIRGENLTGDLLGGLKSPGMKMLLSDRECLGDRFHRLLFVTRVAA